MIHSQRETRELIEDIEERGEGLNTWEQQFIDDLKFQETKLTPKQRELVDRIHREKCR